MFKTIFAGAVALAFSVSAAQAEGEWKKLISPAELIALQTSAAPLVLDIRAAVDKNGGPSFAAGHIPGAVSAPYGRWRGPKDNPGQPLGDAALTDLLQSVGADFERPTVVVHQGVNDTDFGAAARVYWTLKSAGISQIAILNGGVNGWVAAKHPLSTEASAPEPSTIVASLSDKWLATRDDIDAAIDGQTNATLLDARPVRQHLGLSKHKAAKTAGTLPGALRFSQTEWFDYGSPMMSTPEGAQAIAASSNVGDAPVISFCNTGHWAATNWFALSELAGQENVKMYPGSMVDWTRANGRIQSAVDK